MSVALSAVVGSLASAYIFPRVTEFAWRNAFTWMGRTAATWAVVALLWDITVNNGNGDTFDGTDLAGSAAISLGVRMVL